MLGKTPAPARAPAETGLTATDMSTPGGNRFSYVPFYPDVSQMQGSPDQ